MEVIKTDLMKAMEVWEEANQRNKTCVIQD